MRCVAGDGCHVYEGCLMIISEDQEPAAAYPDQRVMPFMSLPVSYALVGYAFHYDVWCRELGVLYYRQTAFCCLQLCCRCTHISVSSLAFSA